MWEIKGSWHVFLEKGIGEGRGGWGKKRVLAGQLLVRLHAIVYLEGVTGFGHL